MNSIFRENNLIYLLLFLAIISGFVIIEDYGIGIEEHFQRKSGFFWLNFLFNFTEFEFLKNQIIEKINEITYIQLKKFRITVLSLIYHWLSLK